MDVHPGRAPVGDRVGDVWAERPAPCGARVFKQRTGCFFGRRGTNAAAAPENTWTVTGTVTNIVGNEVTLAVSAAQSLTAASHERTAASSNASATPGEETGNMLSSSQSAESSGASASSVADKAAGGSEASAAAQQEPSPIPATGAIMPDTLPDENAG
jgi:hypothetical protein